MLFVATTTRNAQSGNIDTLVRNAVRRDRIRPFTSHKGVPVCRLRGYRDAGQHKDFHDGSPDSLSGKNQSRHGLSPKNSIWTDSQDIDGGDSIALGLPV